MPSYDEDFAWQERFGAHYSDIARQAIRVDVAPNVEDWKRNTDFILTATFASRGRDIRVSARARRRKYLGRYPGQFTVRLDRPSGAETEMPKLRKGWGDLMIYGFESEVDSDRLGPWWVINLEMLRDYLACGGYYRSQDNRDGSSSFAVFWLEDMPLGFVLASEGIKPLDRSDVWFRCRRCWTEKVAPAADELELVGGARLHKLGDGYWRRCLYCHFQWRAGWVASLIQTAPRSDQCRVCRLRLDDVDGRGTHPSCEPTVEGVG